MWAATFIAIMRASHAGGVATAAVYAGYLVPIVFTRRYPAIVRYLFLARS